MEARRRFVENKQIAHNHRIGRRCNFPTIAWAGWGVPLYQMTDEFQPLGFAAAQRIQRLPQSQITQSDFVENFERIGERLLFSDLREPCRRFRHGEIKHIMDRLAVQSNFEHVWLETPSLA